MSVEAVTKFLFDGVEPYLQYADSGTEELGSVPEHWLVRSFRSVAHRTSERDCPDLPLLSVVRERGVIPRASMSDEENHNFVPDDLTNYKVVREGNLVINKMKAWQGSMGIAPMDGIVSPAYFVFDLSMANPAFAHRLLRSKAYVALFGRVSDGVRIGQWDLSVAGMKQIPVLIPPPDEQAAIVRFLDHADRRIQRYIRAKKKLIALLNEQKQAIIHHAVTRGLDPNVRLKPSGVEWLGDVPEHWRVWALKRVLRDLIDCEHKTAPAVDASDYRVVRTTAVRYGQLRLQGMYSTTREAFEQWTRRGRPEAGDVIFTREAPAGEACLVPAEYAVCLGQRTVLMRVNRDIYDPEFLVYMIYGGPPADRIRLASQGSTVSHFNMDEIADMPILVPKLQEQVAIVATIRAKTHILDVTTARAEQEIDLLHEYRTRLISDVVTGKLDVRKAAAKLPHEDDDIDPLDDIAATLDGDEEMPDLDVETPLEEVAS